MNTETKNTLKQYFKYKKYIKITFIVSCIISSVILINFLDNYEVLKILFTVEYALLIFLFGLSFYFTSKINKLFESIDLKSESIYASIYKKNDTNILKYFTEELANIKNDIKDREEELKKIIESSPDAHKNLFQNDGKLNSLVEKAQEKEEELIFLKNLSKYI